MAIMFSSSNYGPDPTLSTTSGTTIYAQGDILRVCKTSTGLVLEGGAGCNFNFPFTGGGDFYDDNRFPGNGTIKEDGGGALALLAGSGQIVSTGIDVMETNENSVGWWNNTNGVRNRAYELTQGVSSNIDQGKASGLGDIELLCNAAPIEIGNRVWDDTDNDGIQDAGELPISDVTVYALFGFCSNYGSSNSYYRCQWQLLFSLLLLVLVQPQLFTV